MPTTRRQFLSIAGGATVAGTIPIVTLRPLEATPAMLSTAIRNVVGEAQIRTGKIKLDVRDPSYLVIPLEDGRRIAIDLGQLTIKIEER